MKADDLAAVRVDECLEALASICSLVQPAAQQTAEVADAFAGIVRRLGFIAEREEARAPLDVAAFFTRPRVKIQGVRQVEDEAALLGHVYIFGVMHHAWFVQVEEQDSDQVAVDEPPDRQWASQCSQTMHVTSEPHTAPPWPVHRFMAEGLRPRPPGLVMRSARNTSPRACVESLGVALAYTQDRAT